MKLASYGRKKAGVARWIRKLLIWQAKSCSKFYPQIAGNNAGAPEAALYLYRLKRRYIYIWIGIFTQASPGLFSNSATSEYLRKMYPVHSGLRLCIVFPKAMRPEGWDELEHAVRTGGPSIGKTYGHDF